MSTGDDVLLELFLNLLGRAANLTPSRRLTGGLIVTLAQTRVSTTQSTKRAL